MKRRVVAGARLAVVGVAALDCGASAPAASPIVVVAPAPSSLPLATDRPAPAPSGPDRFVELAVASMLTCARTERGLVYCWGEDRFDGGSEVCNWKTQNQTDYPCRRLPMRVPIERANAIAASSESACAVLESRRVACWGYNLHGGLGDGTTEMHGLPSEVKDLHDAVEVTVGAAHACARQSEGGVWCWGRGYPGQLGDGKMEDRATAAPVVGLPRPADRIVAGGFHTCALLGGEAWCWGDDGTGQLGDGARTSRATPARVHGLPPVVELAAGNQQTCARTADGRVFCWGAVAYLVAGTPLNHVSTVPLEVRGVRATQLALGYARACVRHEDGGVSCWGNESTTLPTRIPDLGGVAALGAAWSNTCTLHTNGAIRCWGPNPRGQIGDGTTEDRSAPTLVHLPAL